MGKVCPREDTGAEMSPTFQYKQLITVQRRHKAPNSLWDAVQCRLQMVLETRREDRTLGPFGVRKSHPNSSSLFRLGSPPVEPQSVKPLTAALLWLKQFHPSQLPLLSPGSPASTLKAPSKRELLLETASPQAPWRPPSGAPAQLGRGRC